MHRGIKFMDNAWDYNNGDGQGEIKMRGVARRLSLKRLQTDRIDLFSVS